MNPYQHLFDSLKARSQLFRSEKIRERRKRLEQLSDWLEKNRNLVEDAVYKDLGKPAMEVSTSEIFPVLSEINHTLDNLDRWTAPVKVDAPLTFIGTRSYIIHEPKGACLIIAPWNYPFNLAIGPLVSCIAAGNTALIKPSELTPNTSALLSKLVGDVFPKDVVAVVEGDAEAASALLQLPFDHIFFTGSPAVGKIVMKAAAERLASVTLELGGKSPAIIDTTADLKDAARRIAFGKFVNNGQTCIAPDYVLVDESIRERFIALLIESIRELFGRDEDRGHIVSRKHVDRLQKLLSDAVQKGGTVHESFKSDHDLSFPWAVVSNVTADMLLMEEEIFGPILPVVSMDPGKSIEFINKKPKPLALYVFSHNRSFRDKVLAETSAGGVCINDCLLQFAHPNLPFGGVNNSGIGKGHGHAGFLAFTNEKPVVRQKSGYSNAYVFYPPYTSFKRKILAIILRWFA